MKYPSGSYLSFSIPIRFLKSKIYNICDKRNVERKNKIAYNKVISNRKNDSVERRRL